MDGKWRCCTIQSLRGVRPHRVVLNSPPLDYDLGLLAAYLPGRWGKGPLLATSGHSDGS